MNEEIILKMAKPYVKNGSITYQDFDAIYDILSLREQYQVVEILYKHQIQLDEASQTESEEEVPELVALAPVAEDILPEGTSAQPNDFNILYDESIFKDTTKEETSKNVVLYEDIKQSNEILCRLIQQGSCQARQDLCIKNQRLVMKYANMYYKLLGNDLESDDLMQAGYIGLLTAAEKFDISRDTAFSTYAVYWIKQAISREIMDNGFVIGMPVHMIEKIFKVTRLDNSYGAMGMAYKERMEAVAAELGYTVDQVEKYIALRIRFLTSTSLNTPIGEEEDTQLEELIEDKEQACIEDIVMNHALAEHVREIISTLTPREERVICLRYGLDDGRIRTLEEIGQEFHLTRERIRQIEARAFRRLRHPSRSKKIKEFCT